ADADHGIDAQLAGVDNNFVGNIARDFLSVFDGAVFEGIAAIRGTQDSAAARQNAAHILECEFIGFFWPDQPVETVRDANDLPLIFQEGGLHRRANHGVEAGGVPAASADSDTAD